MSEWYKDWFNSEEYLTVYKHRNDQDADKLLKLIFNNVDIPKKSNVLDAACGAGRHSIQLAKNGFNVTGFDLSDTLLKIAKINAVKQKADINFINSDIRNFYSKTNFSLIVNLFTSFGYFDSDDENFKFFENAFSMLLEGGYLVFDYFNSNYLMSNLVPISQKQIGDLNITEKRTINNNRVKKEIIIKKNSLTKSFIESVKLYDFSTILSKFEEIGYKNFKIFGDFEGDSFNELNSDRLIIICQK